MYISGPSTQSSSRALPRTRLATPDAEKRSGLFGTAAAADGGVM